jgi:23S rRNA (adenine2503-C2)-methyltransferase
MTTSEKVSETPATGGLFDQTPDSLRALFKDWGEPAFRCKQVVEWVYEQGVTTYEEMTNLSKSLRAKLAETLPFYQSTIVKEQRASDGTRKLLLAWTDGATSECVMIPDGDRRTACISTQVGCPVGCVFCASGLDGLQRQLTAGQIIEQAMRVRGLCEAERLSNVVFMGLGEPLSNYVNTVHAVRTINAEWGLSVGARKITVSTVGLPTQMRKLADEKLQITLALSLHAPNDELRRELIPWADRVTISELVDAANYYFEKTGREVTLEYILLGGKNDSRECARDLAKMSKWMRSNINLIPYNAVEGLPFECPTVETVEMFHSMLRERGVNAHIRTSRGSDIDGACGQLRRREGADFVSVSTPSKP